MTYIVTYYCAQRNMIVNSDYELDVDNSITNVNEYLTEIVRKVNDDKYKNIPYTIDYSDIYGNHYKCDFAGFSKLV